MLNIDYQRNLRRARGAIAIGTLLTCPDCGGQFPYISGPQKRCKPCAMTHANALANGINKSHPKRGQWRRTTKDNRAFGKDTKAAILERDGHACVRCRGATRLHVHHIDGRGKGVPRERRNNAHGNLITLCTTCHRRLHAETERRLYAAHPKTVLAVFKEFVHST